jgi:hypothetical protein
MVLKKFKNLQKIYQVFFGQFFHENHWFLDSVQKLRIKALFILKIFNKPETDWVK